MSEFRKIWLLLTPRQRARTVPLLLLMTFGMALEALGVGLIIPAISMIGEAEKLAAAPEMRSWVSALGNPTPSELVVGAMVGFVLIHIFRTLFLAFLAWRQSKFAYAVQADMAQRLFETYLRQPWAFHLRKNSAELVRNVTSETAMYMAAALQPLMALITEGMVLLGIAALLLFVEPVGALVVVVVLTVCAWIFNRSIKVHVAKWGEARQFHEGLRLQHLQQGLGGAKDVKLLGREEEFFRQHLEHCLGSARVSQRQYTIAQLPRLWLELLAVVGVAVLVLLMVVQGKPLDALVPVMGLFAAAAFRAMPAANRILNSLQSIRWARPVIDTLYSDLPLGVGEAPERKGVMPFRNALVLAGIGFRYEGAPTVALDDISIRIPNGSTVGFVGGSGAGKSTLVDVILGLLSPTTGRILVDGVDIRSNIRGWQDQIGYVPQSIYLTDDSLRRNVAFGIADEQIDDGAVLRAIEAAQLAEFVSRLPEGLETSVGERGVRLSGGQRQRIGIARALYHDPQLLVLDEATSALDTTTEGSVMDAVNSLHGTKTILIVAHRLSTLTSCDYLYRLENGRLVQHGAYAEVTAAYQGVKQS